MTQFTDEANALQKLPTASSVLQKRDTKVIEVKTVKDAGVSLDFAGELNAVQQRMTEAMDRGRSALVAEDPSRLARSLTAIERAQLSGPEGHLHDAKQRIAEEEYDVALRLLDELISLEPAEARQKSTASVQVDGPALAGPSVEGDGPAQAEPALQTLGEVASGKGWARRNDPCPCGSGKKYKRCHGA